MTASATILSSACDSVVFSFTLFVNRRRKVSIVCLTLLLVIVGILIVILLFPTGMVWLVKLIAALQL